MDKLIQGISSQSYEGSSDPKEFFKSFYLQASMFKWDANEQARVIPFFLKGKAERVFNAMQADKDKIDKIEEAIIKGCTQSQEALLDAFYSRRPREYESVSQFAVALLELLSKAVPTLGNPEKLIFCRHQLNVHLPKYMRALIQYNSKQSWDDLLVALDQASPHVEISCYNNQSSSGALNIKQEPLEFNATSASQSQNKFTGLCNYCKKPGHKLANCFKREQANSRSNKQTKPPSENSQSFSQNHRGSDTSHRGSRSTNSNQSSSGSKPSGSAGRNKRTDANAVSLFNGDSDSAESYTIELKPNNSVLDLASLSTTPLLFRSVNASLCREKFKLKALFDCGATNCFIRLAGLPENVRKKVEQFRDQNVQPCSGSGFRKRSFTIRGATSSVEECCVIANVRLSMRGCLWEHEFIITENLKGKDMIIGRDFLTLYNVVINNGDDSITINKPNKPVLDTIEESCERSNHVQSLSTSVHETDSYRTCVLLNNVVIEPRTEKLVKCRVLDSKIEEPVLFCPQVTTSDHFCAYSVSTCNKQGELVVSILNPSDKAVKLDANLQVGTVTSNFSSIENSESVEVKSVALESKMTPKSKQKIDISNLNKIKFGKNLNEQQQSRLIKLIKSKHEAFQMCESDIGLTNLIEHKIDTGNHSPIKQRQHRLPQALHGEVEKQVKELLDADIIQKSESPWASPLLIIKQKTREGKIKYRFVIDMRKLNELTVKDAYPLPRIDQTLDAIGNVEFLTVLDAARGYFQVNLREEDREKTAFVANNQLYEFKRMALGLTNAPSTYSRLMDIVLSGLTYKYCLVYLDDTIIFSNSFDDHYSHIEEILNRFINARIKLKPEKCVFAADSVPYLGFIITTKGISPNSDKVKAIVEMPFPSTAKGMIRFLGAVNFYRDFIPRYSFTASILYKISQSNAKFKSKSKLPAAKEAFEKLKNALVTAPVLAYPDFTLPFIICSDASNVAVGAVLGQLVDNKYKPVMYASRHLTGAESRYSTTERELLAIVWSAKRFNAYIYGRHVKFITDHEPLVTLKTLKEPNGRIGRLFNKIQDIDYTLTYQPGSRNFTADLLSRPEVEAKTLELHIQSCINWKLEQSLDTSTRRIREFLKGGNSVDVTTLSEIVDFKEWEKVLNSLSVDNEILVFRDENCDRIVVPAHIIQLVLEFHHDSQFAGHREFEKTLSSIKCRYFWIHMHRDVKSYCSTCHLCQTKKHLNSSFRAPLKPITVDQPWILIGIDVSGPLVRTPNGNLYIILAIDYFSKFCIGKATPDATALTTARFLFEDIICRFGMFKSLLSDHGKNFKSILFAQLCKLCGIKAINSTFYHPEGNGLIERTIYSVKQILTMYVDVTHQNWDVHLQAAISAYNASKHSSIGCSPYEVVFGRKPVLVADIVLSNRVNVDPKPLAEYLKNIQDSSAQIQNKVRDQINKSQVRQKAYYDRFVRNSAQFSVGDFVLLVNERSIVGQSKSFRDRLIGPFKIIDKYNDVNYRIVCIQNNKVQDVHYNRLRPYRSRVDFIQTSTINEQVVNDVSNQNNSNNQIVTQAFLVSQLVSVFNSQSPIALTRYLLEENDISLINVDETPSFEHVDPLMVKTSCPVCHKEFKRVAIHIGKSKDQFHKDYKAKQKQEQEQVEQVVDHMIQAIDSAN
jgi:hypothetical protein